MVSELISKGLLEALFQVPFLSLIYLILSGQRPQFVIRFLTVLGRWQTGSFLTTRSHQKEKIGNPWILRPPEDFF